MTNNLVPMRKKNNIFKKVKDFFFRLFKKEKKKNDFLAENMPPEKLDVNPENVFKKDVKVNVSNDSYKMDSKDEFIRELENDITLLEHLSIDRLEILNKYYDELIEKDKIELKKLNANNNN